MKCLLKRAIFGTTALTLLITGLVLSGCGGGIEKSLSQSSSDPGNGVLASKIVSGEVSVGAPFSGQVSLTDASNTPQVKTTVVGSDGTFAIDVTDMNAPYVLEAKGNAGETNYTLYSFAHGSGVANINPLSNVAVASAAEVDDPAEVLAQPDQSRLQEIESNLPSTITDIQSKLKPLLTRYNSDREDPIKGHYISDHLGHNLFSDMTITITKGVVTIINSKTDAVIFTGKLSELKNWTIPDDDDNLPPAPAVPDAPSGVAAVGGSGQITISWNSVENASSYNIYYGTASGVTISNGTKVANVTSPYVHDGLTAGATFYYIVTAANSAGESIASIEGSATTTADLPAVPDVPPAPTKLIATGGTNQVTISWSKVSGATSYNLYWSTTSGVTKANGTKISNAVSPAVHSNLSVATTYYYIVTAVNSTGESADSVQVAGTTLSPAPTPTPPSSPTGVTATGGAGQVTLSWSAVSGATSYNIYWSTTSGVTTKNGTKIAGTTSPYVHTGLTDSTTYYYIVTAINSAGESPASAEVNASTSAPAVDGAALYTQYCSGCHGPLSTSNKRGATAAQIQTKHSSNYASSLSSAQVDAIASALNF